MGRHAATEPLGGSRCSSAYDGALDRRVATEHDDSELAALLEERARDGGPASRRRITDAASIDHDGTEYDRMAERDTPIGALMRAHRGFRPVCFYSPYEAAVGAVLGQRMPIRRAAVLRRRLAETAGTAIDVAGEKLFALPAPDALLGVRAFDGLPREKLARLHEVARAVERGVLDAERLRAMPTSEALASLRSIRGIGNWSAEHILMRGTGATDALPIAEPRVAAATAIAYADDSLARDQDEFVNIARQWRPFRMWASVLLVWCHGFSSSVLSACRGRRPRRL